MKIKDIFSDIKVWAGLIVFFVLVGVSFAGWIKLPTRVEKVEEKAQAVEDNVQKLAGDIGTYIAKQEVMKEEQDKREQLMLELIRKKR